MKRLLFMCWISVLLASCGGGGGDSQTPSPVTPAPTPTPTPVTPPVMTPIPILPGQPSAPNSVFEQQKYAARLLNQASFGATKADIDRVVDMGADAWLLEQLETVATSHVDYLENVMPQDSVTEVWRDHRMHTWFNIKVKGQDQLRQRVAYALSQIFVISDKSTFDLDHEQIAKYYDMLAGHAFGNYRDLLEDVTLSPLMGIYLSMRGNEKPDQTRNIRPDENYAREIMQLFSIGLVELNIDGTPKLDSNNEPIPTYDQAIIKAYAKVFTGWNFANTTEQSWYWYWRNYNTFDAMTAVEAYHDKTEKQLLNNVLVPAGQNAEDDLKIALDSLFNHPNVGPFISKKLIQHLVTSNPSPEYIARVSEVFNSNSQGKRGDLREVIIAILADPVARADYDEQAMRYGRVKEPIMRAVQSMRALKAFTPGGEIKFGYPDWAFNQAPLSSPSVFNFYFPDHQPQGQLSEMGLAAPEYSILTENYIVRNSNYTAWNVLWGHYVETPEDPDELIFEYAYEASLVDNTDALLDHLNLVLLGGSMSPELRELLVDYHEQSAQWGVTPQWRVAELAFLIASSPQYAVQR